MAKVATLQSNFNAGEFSPLMQGRVDFGKYKNALATCLNWIGTIQGPLTRRPGTRFVCEVKNSANATRLVKFQFSNTQSYILEFGNLYIRVYKNHGQIQSNGSPVEIVTPYLAADVALLKFTQSADTLYIAHPSYEPAILGRSSDTAWTYTKLVSTLSFLDGPYLPINPTATTLTASGTGGSVTLTASATTGINNGSGFLATDVNRLVRLLVGSTWGWGIITAVGSTTSATVNVQSAFGGTTATASWRLGLWSATTGYPGCVVFHEDRLTWAGSNSATQQINASVVGDYFNHAPSATNGAVGDSNALSFTLNSNDVQIILWLMSDEKGLLAGTQSGEWLIRPSSQGEALTPTNVNAKQSTSYGSKSIQALHVGKATLFVQKAGRKVRELMYDLITDGFKGPDVTVLSQHITLGGVIDWAYQQEPQGIIWAVRGDGILLGFTYDREQDILGWHRHQIGGASDSNGTPAIVESVACIPEPNGTYDELWMIVRRWINGASHRYIEYLTKIWEDGDTAANGVFVDCSAQYSGVKTTTITGLSYLQGETVAVLGDGAVQTPQIVNASGQITIPTAAATVQVGYSYDSDAEDLVNDAGSANGTAQGKTQRTHRDSFKVLDTLGLSVGDSFTNLSPVYEIGRTAADDLGTAVPLYTGIVSFTHEGDYTMSNNVCWRVSDPLPATIIATTQQLMTQDR